MEEERQIKRVWLKRSVHKQKRGNPREAWDSALAECLKKPTLERLKELHGGTE